MMAPGSPFTVTFVPSTGQPAVTIVDTEWWIQHSDQVIGWITENLPRGIEHVQGMNIVFDKNADRLAFLLVWGYHER